MFTFEYDDSRFREWVSTARARYETMLLTMIDVAELIRANTNQRVPLDTGRLESSFFYEIVENTSQFIQVEVGYSIEKGMHPENTGFVDSNFDYAYYQHQGNFNHPKRGEQFYLMNGVHASEDMAFKIIQTDYMSLFGTFRGGY